MEQPPAGATFQTNDGSYEGIIHKSLTATSAKPRHPPAASPPLHTVSVVSGWILQRVSSITPVISQILHNPFPAMYSSSITDKTGEDGSPPGQGWSSNIIVNQQPKCSIASFPADQPTSMDGPLKNSRGMMLSQDLHNLPVPGCSQQLISPDIPTQESIAPTQDSLSLTGLCRLRAMLTHSRLNSLHQPQGGYSRG